MGKQTFVIQLDPDIARQLRRYLASGRHGYASISEFVQVAVQNQLTIETEGSKPLRSETDADRGRESGQPTEFDAYGNGSGSSFLGVADLLQRPPSRSPLALVEPSVAAGEPLSPFTNRLSPVKVAARAVANLAGSAEWPEIEVFQRESALAARALGQRLRDEDSDGYRRWIGYPVGDDVDKSIARFASSFTISAREDRLSGPLAILGLASIRDGRVGLTRNGWRLAAAPSPLIDGAKGRTISAAEAQILRECICNAPVERQAVLEFLQLVRVGHGRQAEIDAQLAELRPNWSREMVVAHRAAMLGRLAELGLVEARGRGLAAIIDLLPSGAEFVTQLQEEDVSR